MRDGHHGVAASEMETPQLHGLEDWRDGGGGGGGAVGSGLDGKVDDGVGEAAGDVGAGCAGGDGDRDDGARDGLDE